MKAKRKTALPIGRTAMVLFQMIALRDECCAAAEALMSQRELDESALEECARLDDALAEAHRVLKFTLARLTLARLKRKGQAK